MKKILIVSYKFPPYNSMGSRRWSEMIPTLRKYFEVYVFTTNVEGDLEVNLPKHKIKRYGSVSNLLFNKSKQQRSFFHKIISIFTRKMRTIDSTIISWYLKYRKKFLQYYTQINPDIIITSSVSITPAMFGYLIKSKNPSTIWINDLRDSMSIYNKHEKNIITHIADKFIDKMIIKKADHLFTVSKTLKKILSAYYNKATTTIYNGFKFSNNNGIKEYNNLPQLYYAGRIYPHRERAFLILLQAIKKKKVKLKLRLLGEVDQFKKYKKIINRKNLKNVELMNPSPASVVEKEIQNSDVVIIFEEIRKIDEVSKGTLTGKLFELLPHSAAILAICRDDSEIGTILKKTQRGEVVSSKKQILDFLDNYKNYCGYEEKLIAQFSRKNQALKVVRTLQKI